IPRLQAVSHRLELEAPTQPSACGPSLTACSPLGAVMVMADRSSMTVLTGNANPQLAHDIARHLMMPLGRATVGRFSDSDTTVELLGNVRGCDIFIVQSSSPPANVHLMVLLVMVDACRRASAGRITADIPYFG